MNHLPAWTTPGPTDTAPTRSYAARLAVGVVLAVITFLPGVLVLAPAAAVAPTTSDSVLMTVDGITPSSPLRGYPKRQLRIQLSVTNQTSESLNKLSIVAERGDPITSLSSLDQAMADPSPPPNGGLPIPAMPKSTFSVAAGATVDVIFQTTTSFSQTAGLCLCGDAVYPLFLSTHRVTKAGSDTELGSTSTYLPVFYKSLPRLRVGWVWPIIDRPHRQSSDSTFTDDDLTTSITPGGRLDHLLSVVEEVPAASPLTVLLDPETIDEIQVMTGKYRVQSGRRTVAGTGQAVAAQWLARLRAALAAHPSDNVELTPYADPDVESLADRGLAWKTDLPAAMAARVKTALGDVTTNTNLAWPVAPRISKATLNSLSESGVDSVVLNSDAVDPQDSNGAPAPGVVRLTSSKTDLTGLVVDSELADSVSSAVVMGGAGAAALPTLMSELGVRVTADPSTSHAVVLTPPRDVDPSVANAVAAISTTTVSPFTSPITVPDAVTAQFLPEHSSTLRRPTHEASQGLSDTILSSAAEVTASTSTITSLLSCANRNAAPCAAASTLIGSLPGALQRTESSAWRQDAAGSDNPGDSGARALSSLVRSLIAGVRIAPPRSGDYTLASTSAPLPITIVNNSDFADNVMVRVSTIGGLPGFSTADVGVKVIPAHRKVTVQLPATVQRTGSFRVQAVLTTPNGSDLGPPVALTVHSTALGRIGVIITVTAGILLLCALLYRGARTLSRRRRRKATGAPSGIAS